MPAIRLPGSSQRDRGHGYAIAPTGVTVRGLTARDSLSVIYGSPSLFRCIKAQLCAVLGNLAAVESHVPELFCAERLRA